jgi:murein L,D-transpeptidase YcbB/YkuD
MPAFRLPAFRQSPYHQTYRESQLRGWGTYWAMTLRVAGRPATLLTTDTQQPSSAQAPSSSTDSQRRSSAGTQRPSTESQPSTAETPKSPKDKGHDPGSIDGVMGPRTARALKDFQKAEGLQATGQLDSQTREKLGVEGSAKRQ